MQTPDQIQAITHCWGIPPDEQREKVPDMIHAVTTMGRFLGNQGTEDKH